MRDDRKERQIKKIPNHIIRNKCIFQVSRGGDCEDDSFLGNCTVHISETSIYFNETTPRDILEGCYLHRKISLQTERTLLEEGQWLDTEVDCCCSLQTPNLIKLHFNNFRLFFPEDGVGLVPKSGCVLTLAYYAFPRRYEFGERRWNDTLTGENRKTRRKTYPSATLSTTNPTRARNRASAVRSRRLST
jgi:hypothetical protein